MRLAALDPPFNLTPATAATETFRYRLTGSFPHTFLDFQANKEQARRPRSRGLVRQEKRFLTSAGGDMRRAAGSAPGPIGTHRLGQPHCLGAGHGGLSSARRHWPASPGRGGDLSPSEQQPEAGALTPRSGGEPAARGPVTQ